MTRYEITLHGETASKKKQPHKHQKRAQFSQRGVCALAFERALPDFAIGARGQNRTDCKIKTRETHRNVLPRRQKAA